MTIARQLRKRLSKRGRDRISAAAEHYDTYASDVGDRNVMRSERAVKMFRLLPHSRLAVLPGTDHMTLMRRTAWLVPVLDEFLMKRR